MRMWDDEEPAHAVAGAPHRRPPHSRRAARGRISHRTTSDPATIQQHPISRDA
jgi:hypothetical protein